jgi:hypothetical protein
MVTNQGGGTRVLIDELRQLLARLRKPARAAS